MFISLATLICKTLGLTDLKSRDIAKSVDDLNQFISILLLILKVKEMSPSYWPIICCAVLEGRIIIFVQVLHDS